MSEPVWWCPVCGGIWSWGDGVPLKHYVTFDAECPGTPIDLVAERKRLLEELETHKALAAAHAAEYAEFHAWKRWEAKRER